jgi:hypothetical protein
MFGKRQQRSGKGGHFVMRGQKLRFVSYLSTASEAAIGYLAYGC